MRAPGQPEIARAHAIRMIEEEEGRRAHTHAHTHTIESERIWLDGPAASGQLARLLSAIDQYNKTQNSNLFV